ncbi:hypothetical protein ACK3SF_02910 [Candidatus Nanosalina sp. VS9-1]|uniref:hypothetical protein n=1 Tax=Candidatus Nanosalina sp. VS9-1 TaxID=3388566 RepID=UPI0039E0C3AB
MEDLSRAERENLHKWGKARRIIDEEKIVVTVSSDDRYQFAVEGDNADYTVGVDIDSGESFCPCPFQGDLCSHQIAAHLYLTRLGVER